MAEPSGSNERGLQKEGLYRGSELNEPLLRYEISKEALGFHHCFGLETNKRHNLHLIDDDTILTSSGNIALLIGK